MLVTARRHVCLGSLQSALRTGTHLAPLFLLAHLRPALSVRRYCCRRLLGLSGMVRSIKPASSAVPDRVFQNVPPLRLAFPSVFAAPRSPTATNRRPCDLPCDCPGLPCALCGVLVRQAAFFAPPAGVAGGARTVAELVAAGARCSRSAGATRPARGSAAALPRGAAARRRARSASGCGGWFCRGVFREAVGLGPFASMRSRHAKCGWRRW